MTTTRRAAHHAPAATSSNRVPEPDAAFWVIKVLTTGMGETISDYFVRAYAPELVVPIAFVALLAMLALQFAGRRYRPAIYWSTALMVSIFGTMAADVAHVGFGIPYVVSVAGFATALAVIFLAWYRTERTLSVHAITSTRREVFYWAAVMTTFALGTAVGDLTATVLHLGYLGSGIVFAIAFAIPGVVFGVTRRWAILTFWIAYILTRPFGASFADWFAVSHARGGLNLGSGPVSLVLLAFFAALVSTLALTYRSPTRRPHTRPTEVTP